MKYSLAKNKHQSNIIRKKYKNKKKINKQFANHKDYTLAKKKIITKNIYNKENINEIINDPIQNINYYFNKDYQNESIYDDILDCSNQRLQEYENKLVINMKQYTEKMLKDKLLKTYEIV